MLHLLKPSYVELDFVSKNVSGTQRLYQFLRVVRAHVVLSAAECGPRVANAKVCGIPITISNYPPRCPNTLK